MTTVAGPTDTSTRHHPVDSTGTGKRARDAGFRPEIEGLRAVAVLMVAVYHIWFGRVSGGVDVFLVLTGFLISGSLLRMAESQRRIRFGAFWSRLFKRLFPPVGVVLFGVLIASYMWLSSSRWRATIDEVLASALYFENWKLATSAVDYLDREELPSPVQHFWSLSMQGQFYVLWAVAIAVALIVAKRMRWSVRTTGLAVFIAVFLGSLTYSVIITGSNQAWAYFDLGARLWEFALGGILAVVLPYLRLPGRLRVVLGWLGLIALVLCGALFNVSALFPGYVALWPVGAAILVIIAGTTGHRFAVDRFLTWQPLTYLGGLSYALYLWHWPVLIVYLAVQKRTLATIHGGLAVLAVSLVLAFVTKKLLENPVNTLTRRFSSSGWGVGVVAFFLAPVLLASALWTHQLNAQQSESAQAISIDTHPGAQALAFPERHAGLQPHPVLPDPVDARDDLPITYDAGCHASLDATEAAICEHGPGTTDHSIAVVGASRSAHWYPAVREIADRNGWTVYNITKSSCQFSTDTPLTVEGDRYSQCEAWREDLMDTLAELRPDVVLTSSTRAAEEMGEQAFPGFVDRWRQLADLGIDVIGVRDLPRVPIDGPECVATTDDVEECTSAASYSHAPADPALQLTEVPDNVTFIDMTEYVCPDGRCPAVIGNVLVYRDNAHLTATYSRTMAPVLEDEILQATNW